MNLRERVECQSFGVGEPAVEERDGRVEDRDVGVSHAVASVGECELSGDAVEVVAVPVSEGRAEHLTERPEPPGPSDRVSRAE